MPSRTVIVLSPTSGDDELASYRRMAGGTRVDAIILSSPVVGDLGSVDLAHDPVVVADRVRRLRVFRGYSGWGPFQLVSELNDGAWIVLPALLAVVSMFRRPLAVLLRRLSRGPGTAQAARREERAE